MIEWVKHNKVTTLLVIVILFFLVKGTTNYGITGSKSVSSIGGFSSRNTMMSEEASLDMGAMSPAVGKVSSEMVSAVPLAAGGGGERMVINESSLSMVVKDVRESGNKIVKYAEENGGFMVNSSYSRPEESPYASITVRVSSDKFDDALEFYRSLGIKVVYENLIGTDVTEQYTDIEERIVTLTKTKVKFEQILDQATEIQDILQVNQQLIYIQDQIDYWIGQQKSIEQNANLTKITISLSTDEFSLPYVPDTKFRPNVIFKLAVRGLVSSLRGLAEKGIWIAVYSVIWIPVVIVIWVIRKYRKTTNKT